MDELASGAGWEKVRDRPADPQTGRTPVVTWELLPGLRVSYTEDQGLRCGYAVATSFLGESALDTPIAFLGAHPLTLTYEDLLASCDEASEESQTQAVAVARLGLGAPLEEDERFVSWISRLLRSEDEFVREGALWGAVQSEWEVFRDALEQIGAEDTVGPLRDLAAHGLAQLDQIGDEDGPEKGALTNSQKRPPR